MTAALTFTEHQLLEATLKATKMQLAEVQQLARLGSWQVDGLTGRVLWSDELWRIFGLTSQEYGPSFEEFLLLVHPDDRHLIKSVEEKSRENSGEFAYDYRVIHSDGSLRFLRGHGKVVRDNDGRVLRIGGADQEAATNGRLEEIIQPVREAGGESTSPRRWRSRAWGSNQFTSQPTKGATDNTQKTKLGLTVFAAPTTICRQLRRLSQIVAVNPRRGRSHRLGLVLFPPASQAHWMILFNKNQYRLRLR